MNIQQICHEFGAKIVSGILLKERPFICGDLVISVGGRFGNRVKGCSKCELQQMFPVIRRLVADDFGLRAFLYDDCRLISEVIPAINRSTR